MPISHCLTVFLVLAAFASAQGQPDLPEEANALSRRDIVGRFAAEALRNNPGLVAFDKRYQAARESIVSAGALPNPRVQLTHFVESIETRTGPQMDALSLQQPIPWIGRLKGSREVAQSQAEALWHAYADQQFAVVEKVAERALEVAYLDKAISLTAENVSLLEQLESVAEERVRSGGELNALLRLQVEIERFKDLAERQQAERTVAKARLYALLGRDTDEAPLELEWSSSSRLVSDPQSWRDAIRERNPKIVMLRALENSQEARERLARLVNKPEISVGLNYIRTGDALNPSLAGSGDDPWALMVGLSLPIWGKANRAISMQASLETEAIAAQIREQEILLTAEGSAWITKLEDSQNRTERYRSKLLPLARQAKEITESAYKSGNASILDLIDSDRALLKLETEYWRTSADTWVARWKLATLSGGLWLD